LVLRGGEWLLSTFDAIGAEDDAIVWSGPLPTSAISEILVSTHEDRARLTGMARQVSNVALPVALNLLVGDLKWVDEVMPATELLHGLELPSDLDAVHGALTMAVWAVPHIDPWLDLLTAVLSTSSMDVSKLAKAVDASWWRYPPWVSIPDAAWPASREERLWLAAIAVLRERIPGQALAAEDITRKIVAMAADGGSTADEIALNGWADETRRILRADTTIHLDDWNVAPVGKAIQLVLARPMPRSFRTWIEDLPDLPPAIWWSAATLCGLLHGYRRLDGHFRGGATQSRLLAVHALRASDSSAATAVVWPGMPTDAPAWRRESERTILSWGGEDFSENAEKARGRWYVADLTDPEVRRAAEAMARRNEWMDRDLVLSAPLLALGDALHIRLPRSAKIKEVFDAGTFRHCIATERFIVPAPPPSRRSVLQLRQTGAQNLPSGSDLPDRKEKADGSVTVASENAKLASRSVVHEGQIEPLGFRSIANFLSEDDEADLVTAIDKSEWLPVLKRRVQHYGWSYNYETRRIDASMRLGPLPEWAAKLAERLAAESILPHVADQVIVNEYVRNQGISKHIDCIPCFADGVAMVSLLESWEMIFRNDGRKISRVLDRRSVAVVMGQARYRWTHEIPSRMNEPSGFRRGRRISITFRKVIVSSP
jgi:alkylated DNA repair dioxygenase AlkB